MTNAIALHHEQLLNEPSDQSVDYVIIHIIDSDGPNHLFSPPAFMGLAGR